MSRLTIRKNDIALIEEIEYEPCGEVCDRTSCFDCPVGKVTEKLAHYEDLEEQGRLIELPCKVGDTLWRAFNGKVESFVVKEFKIQAYMFDRVEIYFENASGFGLCLFDGTLDENWYKTKEEAEAKLVELKGTEE